MMVERAALIVRITRAMVMGTAAMVSMVVMGMGHGVRGGCTVAGVGGRILLARDGMLEMDSDQRHDAGQLGY